MTIIDSQVHAYEANSPKRPWHSVPNWPDHVVHASGGYLVQQRLPQVRARTVDQGGICFLALGEFVADARYELQSRGAAARYDDVVERSPGLRGRPAGQRGLGGIVQCRLVGHDTCLAGRAGVVAHSVR